MFDCRPDVAGEQRMAVTRRGGELRVELDAHEPAVAWQLHDLGKVLSGRAGADHHARVFEPGNIDIVDFVAVAMALVDLAAVDLAGARIGLDRAFLSA